MRVWAGPWKAAAKEPLSLRAARAKPELLAAEGLSAEQVAELEAYLACPLSALAPRLAYLRSSTAAQDRVVLHQDVQGLLTRVSDTGVQVSVWNAAAAPRLAASFAPAEPASVPDSRRRRAGPLRTPQGLRDQPGSPGRRSRSASRK